MVKDPVTLYHSIIFFGSIKSEFLVPSLTEDTFLFCEKNRYFAEAAVPTVAGAWFGKKIPN